MEEMAATHWLTACTNWAFESLTAPYVEGTSEKILTTWITRHHGSSDLPDSCAG
jgi:hypothetical protein